MSWHVLSGAIKSLSKLNQIAQGKCCLLACFVLCCILCSAIVNVNVDVSFSLHFHSADSKRARERERHFHLPETTHLAVELNGKVLKACHIHK